MSAHVTAVKCNSKYFKCDIKIDFPKSVDIMYMLQKCTFSHILLVDTGVGNIQYLNLVIPQCAFQQQITK